MGVTGSTRSVALRRFPYPVRAGLAICNDADLMTEDGFRCVHRFLNTNKPTPLGPGLGLPISDSVFLFHSPGNPNGFTLFEDLSDRPSGCAEFLKNCAAAGVIDTLHTYGAFSAATDFSRDLARRGIEALEKAGIRLRVWVNHGPVENVQCFGPPAARHFHGDDRSSPFYHTDLTLEYGIEYCWTGAEGGDRIVHDPLGLIAGLREHGRVAVSALLRRRSPTRGCRLLTPVLLRDGHSILRFERFWGTRGQTPVVTDLGRQLSARNLARLKRGGGYTIVYQHFGVRRKAPGFGVDRYTANDPPYFGVPERQALVRLAEEYHSGNIWVTFTQKLLQYNRLHRWLRWKAEETDARIRIVVLGLEIAGTRYTPVDPADLAGLTFYSDRPDETDIYIQRGPNRTQAGDIRCNPKDHTGRASVTIPGPTPAQLDFL